MDVATLHVLWRLSRLLHAEALAGPVPLDDTPPAERGSYLAQRGETARNVAWLRRHARPSGSMWDEKGRWN